MLEWVVISFFVLEYGWVTLLYSGNFLLQQQLKANYLHNFNCHVDELHLKTTHTHTHTHTELCCHSPLGLTDHSHCALSHPRFRQTWNADP